MQKVIIDTDPGTDDAVALIMALNSLDLDIQGLTTVGGNASLEDTTRNALAIIEYLGRSDIPVSKGAARPIIGEFEYADYYHGVGGLTVQLPAPKAQPVKANAADFIIESANASPNEIVLIALGPVTNVAQALQKQPKLKDSLKEIIVMGGAVETAGNVTPYAEFNTYDDAVAANIVFQSGAPITLIGLDVCKDAHFTREDAANFSGESKQETLAREVINGWFALDDTRQGFSLCDPLTIAAAINPDLMTYKQASVVVQESGEQKGKTTASYGNGNIKVALDIKLSEAKEFVVSLVKSSQ